MDSSPGTTAPIRQRPGVFLSAALWTGGAFAAWAGVVGAVAVSLWPSSPSVPEQSDPPPASVQAAASTTPTSSSTTAPAPAPTPPAPGPPSGSAEDLARTGAPLTNAHLSSLDCDRLWTARHWIYARHGCDFALPRAKAYFANVPGYVRQPGRTTAVITPLLSPADRRNLSLVRQFETIRRCK
ncbi:MAG: hypothetical protein RL653_1853 [Pseudomonadota bacterium]